MDTSSYGELGGKVKDCFRLGRGTLHLAGRIWGQIYTWDCKQLFLKACSHNCTIYIPHPYSYLVAEQLALILFQEDCLLQEELCQLFFFFASRLLFAFLLWISASHLPFRFSIPTEKLFIPSWFFHPSVTSKKENIPKQEHQSLFWKSLKLLFMCQWWIHSTL